MNICIPEELGLTEEQKARLQGLGNVTYHAGVPDETEFLKRIERADIVAVSWSPIDTAIPKITTPLKLISLPFTGVGWLPLKEAAGKGIKIANSPGYSTEAVAEFGVGLIISLVRNIHAYANDQPKPETTPTLYGKTLVILGAGRIAQSVGKSAQALGMHVIFWKRGDNLGNVLQKADVLYSALPLSEETKNLLGEKEFKVMKQGSYFVTTSHNKIYDHAALLDALNANLVGAAIDLEGTDTGDYNAEAYRSLRANQKILLTPHIAYKTDYALMRGKDIMIDNIEAFVKGNPINIVN